MTINGVHLAIAIVVALTIGAVVLWNLRHLAFLPYHCQHCKERFATFDDLVDHENGMRWANWPMARRRPAAK